MHSIEVRVEDKFRQEVPVDLLREAALVVLEQDRMKEFCELAIIVTGDKVLRDLNLRFRGVDDSTDVLSFPDETRGPFVSAPGLPRYLGDIVISFPRAEEQAVTAGHSVRSELRLLVVHGVLHLLGYDDGAEQERARMWAVQAEIMKSLDNDAVLPPLVAYA